MLPRHYAPRAALECTPGAALHGIEELVRQGKRVGWLKFGEGTAAPPGVTVIVMPRDPAGYQARLYDVLYRLDEAGVERIVVELPPQTEEWLAVRDRLQRASSGEYHESHEPHE
jgi:L-threonylcarbamoyladenylate synthase